MSDLISIYVVAIFFYLFESVRRTGLQAVVFKPAWSAGRYRARFPAIYPSNGDWGWFVLSLLRPWKPVFVCDPPEVRSSPHGVLIGRLDDASKLHSVEPGEADGGLGDLDSQFDERAASSKLGSFRKCAAWMPMVCASLFFTVIVLFPVMALLLSPAAAVLTFAALLYAQSIPLGLRFARAHAELYGRRATGEAWKIALYPIAAIRAVDELARPLFTAFHPLTVTAVLTGKAGMELVGRRALKDALYPMNAANEDQRARAILEWYSGRLRTHVEGLLAKHKLGPQVLLPVPVRHDNTILSYCPRCESQYQFASGTCPDCPQVPVIAFAGGKAVAK